MGFTLTVNGTDSILNTNIFPPISLKEEYECGLIGLQTYNSIPNVDKDNQRFFIDYYEFEIPVGSYEIDDISSFIKAKLATISKDIEFDLKANNNTLQCEIISNKTIYFDKPNSVGRLLGFSSVQLPPNRIHTSDLPVEIIKVNTIRVDCSIIEGSYLNNKKTHTLHEFSPTVAPGYKINEVPRNVIYLPVTSQEIRSITIKLLDQNNRLINFRGENISVRLHLQPKYDSLQR